MQGKWQLLEYGHATTVAVNDNIIGNISHLGILRLQRTRDSRFTECDKHSRSGISSMHQFLPSTLTRIGNKAFASVSSVNLVYICGTEPVTINIQYSLIQ